MEEHKIIIIIPSFNEINNLKLLLDEINKHYRNEFKIIIADDYSSDGTSDWLLKNNIEFIKSFSRAGYTANLINGMKYIIDKYPNTEYLLTMDADGEHNPSNLFLIKNLVKNFEFIDMFIGSRKTKNRIVEKVLSFIFTRKFEVNDPLSGFKIYKYKMIKKLINQVSTDFFLVDLITLAKKEKMKVKNFNIEVSKRAGSSKIGNLIIANFKLLNCFRLLI